MSKIKAPSGKEELTVSTTEKELECGLQIAVVNLDADPKLYGKAKFGNYPDDGDDNEHCLICEHQVDCIKLSA